MDHLTKGSRADKNRQNSLNRRFKLSSVSCPKISFPVGLVSCESGGRFVISL